MGKRIDRTLLNWRWWAALPLIVTAFALVALAWCLRQTHETIDRSVDAVLSPVMGWVHRRKTGATP